MGSVEQSIEVQVPVSTAYNQWTQFEEFPRFMEGVERVEQLDDTHLHWRASVGGHTEEWDAKITEQIPDERVAWTSTDGKGNGGVVTFHRLNDDTTKVMVQLDYETDGLLEKAADVIGLPERRVKADLERFRELIETRGRETGAWRGEVRHSDDATT
jgi:uncharacterized membrane protein